MGKGAPRRVRRGAGRRSLPINVDELRRGRSSPTGRGATLTSLSIIQRDSTVIRGYLASLKVYYLGEVAVAVRETCHLGEATTQEDHCHLGEEVSMG